MNIENSQELKEYLRSRGILPKGAKLKSQLLTGGVSNRTVKIDFDGNSWVMKQALPKLRVKNDWFSAPERIYYEAQAIRWFDRNMPGTCPRLTFEDKDHFIMAMEAVPHPFENLKDLFLSAEPNAEHFIQAGKLLAEIHSIGLNRENIPDLFFDTQFFESLRIVPYYVECQHQEVQTKDFFDQLIGDTRSDRFTFTHGDYSPKNLLIRNGQLILLDHEVAHFGDGTFDLGFFMAHLLSKAHYRGQHRKKFLQGAHDFYRAYLRSSAFMDPEREQRAVKHSIGCLLARVKGLSQLEYLSSTQQSAQLDLGLNLIQALPRTISELVTRLSKLFPKETHKNP